jgi:hypothetical protein
VVVSSELTAEAQAGIAVAIVIDIAVLMPRLIVTSIVEERVGVRQVHL